CSSAKEILIGVIPQVTASISGSVEICAGVNIKLTAGGGNTYSWSPSESMNDASIFNPMVNPKTTTIYSVIVSNNSNCSQMATVLVKVNPTPTLTAGEDFAANLDEEMFLTAVSNGTVNWISGDGIVCKPCPRTQILPKKSGCYLAEAINEFGCKAMDEVCITVTTEYNIYIPNVFTPNDDGNNDIFTVYGTGLTNIEIIVFDRWGEKLYATKDQKVGWDGQYKGEMCKSDVYPYQIKYTTLDGKNHTKTGHVTLLK
ncbi:MAG: gliding motility-associated C-terminal domain-containing protein, partial [Bacteroidia bacterium]|nr:gliding motility-associated C-terminal domain-containing protein [Bacteroidia bacterium]